MFLSADVVAFILYCAQQLGIMLGVGSETIILIAYFVSLRDGIIDTKEAHFASAVHRTLYFGLGIILISGVGAVVLHAVLGQEDTLLMPAFIFKFLLIVALITASIINHKKVFSHFLWEGFVGATWYALFIIHTLAPVAQWLDILVLYIGWVIGFLFLWTALGYIMQKKSTPLSAPPTSTPKLTPVPVLKPAPAVVSVPVPQKPLSTPVAPVPIKPPPIPVPIKPPVLKEQAPTIPQAEHAGLPVVRVMPRTKEDAERHYHASLAHLS